MQSRSFNQRPDLSTVPLGRLSSHLEGTQLVFYKHFPASLCRLSPTVNERYQEVDRQTDRRLDTPRRETKNLLPSFST